MMYDFYVDIKDDVVSLLDININMIPEDVLCNMVKLCLTKL